MRYWDFSVGLERANPDRGNVNIVCQLKFTLIAFALTCDCPLYLCYSVLRAASFWGIVRLKHISCAMHRDQRPFEQAAHFPFGAAKKGVLTHGLRVRPQPQTDTTRSHALLSIFSQVIS